MTTPLYLHKLQANNFMRLSALSIDADGKHVVITGPNGIGKTSAVEAIYAALAGSDSKETPEPIHHGAEKGSITLDLGEYLIERHFTPSGSRLVVKAADGSKIASPQKILDGLLGKYALDPIAFLERRPQDQLDDVLAVCGIQPPQAPVEELCGEPHQAKPGESADKYLERLSADESGLYYIRRREANRQVDIARGAVVKQEELVSQLPNSPSGAGRPLAEIMDDLTAAEAQQREYEAAFEALTGLEKEQREANDLLTDLQRQKAELEKQLAVLNERITKGTTFLAEILEDRANAAERLEKLQDRRQDIQQLRQAAKDSEANQKATLARQQSLERMQQLKEDLERAQDEHLILDNTLEGLRRLRKSLLEGIDLGVEGLEVGSGQLLLNGVPFKQGSLAQRIRVACAVAMRQQPRLRLLRIDNGEHLDRTSRQYLLRLAQEQEWQVVMTCVADTQELGVEIIDQPPAAEQAIAKPASNGRSKSKLFDDALTAVEQGF